MPDIPLVFLTGADPLHGKGGGSVYVRAHARAAQRAGFEPHVFCLAKEHQVQEVDFGILHRIRTPFRPRGFLDVAPGVDTHRVLAHWLGSFVFSPYAVPIQGRVLGAAVEAFLLARPDAALIHSFYTWGAVAAAVARRLSRRNRRIRVVNNIYTTLAHETEARVHGARQSGRRDLARIFALEALWTRVVASHWERRALTRCDVLGFNYESVGALAREEYGALVHGRRLTYAPETDFLRDPRPPQPKGSNAGPPLIVSISRHDPRKGLDVLLHALAHLQATGVAFRATLGSGGPLLAYHQSLIDSLGLGATVALSGWLDSPDELLLEGDIFVLPSIEEGSGSLALLEAMQYGLAVVASDVDGIPEDITHGVDGRLVPPGDAAALAEALHRLVIDPEERRRMGRAASETFRHHFSARALTDALTELYGALLAL